MTQFALHAVAAVEEMTAADTSKRPARLSMREVLLMSALRSIADGEVKSRTVKAFATESVRQWKECVEREGAFYFGGGTVVGRDAE